MKKLFLLLLCLYAGACAANNVRISAPAVIGANHIRFHIAWDNAWKLEGLQAPRNHDAVWVFVKYREQGGAWQHLDLSPDTLAHEADSLHIEAVKDGKGVFLSRETQGSGAAGGTVKLQWNSFLYPGHFEFRVYAIEMVWVPEGSYYLGDGASQSTFRRGDAMKAMLISSEKAIPLGHDSLSLNDTGKYAPAAAIPAAFPKGYQGFYCMKYEISQAQYVGFLNSLSFAQQKAHVAVSPVAGVGTFAFSANKTARNGIAIRQSGMDNSIPALFGCDGNGNKVFDEANDGQNRACSYLQWSDVAAYLDWAALRPITEMEFEKVCRGPLEPVAHEFAWGTPYVTDANTLADDGTAEEHVTDALPAGYGLGSHGYDGPQGPLRAGFGGSDTSSRLSIGAAYYGALEMSGNLWEVCVGTVSQAGLNFDDLLGDGSLTADGMADSKTWPDASGIGYRGGGWNSGISDEFRDLAVSDRFYAGLAADLRRGTSGGRGGR